MIYMTVLGLILAVGAILSGQVLEGAPLGAMVQPAAFVIVFGGTLGAVVAQSSPKDFFLALQMVRWLFHPPITGREEYLEEIVSWSRISHKNGVIKLDSLTTAIKEPMLKSGVEMIVDKFAPEYIRDTLLMDVRIRDARLRNAVKVWESAGGYAPTIGILGSVLGMLQIMNGLGDPAKLGGAIAVSFIATIYGLALANLVFLPMAAKLRAVIFELTLRDELRIEGLTMIAQNKQPRMVERTLFAVSKQAGNVVNLKRAA